MKIVFTGGGTGGHFYPIIAVVERVNKIIDEENILGAKLYFISNNPYDKELLFENGLIYESIAAGKMRTHFSFANFFDVFKMAFGTVNAIFKLFSIYPDVVFGKGGFGSFPTLFAARLLRIPIIIHESDSAPGRVNRWAGHFAFKIALSFEEAAQYFPKRAQKNIAWTGQPIRLEVESASSKEEAMKYFKFESSVPTVLVLGGSQGAELINNTIISALPMPLEKYQVIHQTGVLNFKNVSAQTDVELKNNPNKTRYYPIAFLNPLGLKMAAGAASVVISRAGSTLFEIASWGLPSILVPFKESNADHARKNAFTYAHAGACNVIEEENMTANILNSEIDDLINDKAKYQRMSNSAKAFGKKDAALTIARALVDTALGHEK